MSWTPPLPQRESLRDAEKEAFDNVVSRQLSYGYSEFVKRFMHEEVLRSFPGDRVQPYFAALLNSPLIASGMSDLGVVYRTRGEYPDGMSHADREWVDMVTCDEINYFWVIYVHVPDAVAVGVRAEAILALVQQRTHDLTDIEQLKTRFIRAVARGEMNAALFKSMEAEVGTRAVVEMIAFCGHTLKTKRLMQAFGVPDITRAQLEEFTQAVVDGKVDIPDRNARVPTKS